MFMYEVVIVFFAPSGIIIPVIEIILTQSFNDYCLGASHTLRIGMLETFRVFLIELDGFLNECL